MVKKRLIFCLLYQNENFYLSRNFHLQKIGNLDWLIKNYNFSLTAKSIDELIILDVSRNESEIKKFTNAVKKIIKNCFIPVSIGGKIDTFDKAKEYILSGADKLVINSSLFNNKLINQVANTYGSQSIIGSFDFRKEKKIFKFYKNNGTIELNKSVDYIVKKINSLNIGEVIFNSIDQDGTGNGLDLSLLKKINKKINKPIIISGGVGNYKHILEAFMFSSVGAVSTSNLVNFVGQGLQFVRNELIKNKIDIAKW